MTTKPRAKKFRIRREPLAEPAGAAPPVDAASPPPPQAGQAGQDQMGRDQIGEVSSPAEVELETDIDAIRKEGLTGRQLRMARRIAQKHDIAVTSDFDAVRQLRKRGIDPFQRSSALELVVSDRKEPEKLPQTVAEVPRQTLPSTEVNEDTESPAERRAREIHAIQRDIGRRRRRKMVLLSMRMLFFIILPTVICGWYFYRVATPQYATTSDFIIQTADQSGGGALGGLLPAQMNTNQEAVAVQRYLQSREALLRLDADLGFKAHFQQPMIDPILRLPDDASNEEAYKLYKRKVRIGYDPTEGVMGLEVIAVDPQTSKAFSEALILYAEERVDNQTKRKREDQLSESRNSLVEAEAMRREAQEALVQLQQEASIVDPEGVIGALRQQITTREIELQEKQIQLQALQDNARPNQSRVDGVKGDIRRLENAIKTLQTRMNVAATGADSLAAISAKVQLAQADVATRDLMLQSALQNLEAAQLEASRQTRYLSRGVEPVAPDEPTYPRAFENTIVSFLIFAGIYLMISLTASILREQVTS